MGIADILNVLGLSVTTAAAVLMYYFPPRGLTQYTVEGAAEVQWVNNATSDGRAKAARQARLSRLSTLLLALGFTLQLIAAILPVFLRNAA